MSRKERGGRARTRSGRILYDRSLNFILTATESHLRNIPQNCDLKSPRWNYWNFLDASNRLPLGPRLSCLA